MAKPEEEINTKNKQHILVQQYCSRFAAAIGMADVQ
jgi:hypothetical protein